MNDGHTIPITNSVPRRETPGFGCPHCGASIDARNAKSLIVGVLPCCGSFLDGRAASRLLRASKVIEEYF